MDDNEKKQITDDLEEIVERFNNDFKQWSYRHGTVANFLFDYRDGKKILINSIDVIVHRREAPSAKTIQDVLKQGNKDKK